jgi:hypothetical protein
VQLCPGEGQGRRKDPEARVGAAWNRGAAHSREEEEIGRRSADEGAREKKGSRNRAGGLGKKKNGCSTNDERCLGAGRGRRGARKGEGRGNDGQEARWREVAWGGRPRAARATAADT